MSLALDDVCRVLKLQDDSPAKEVIATRIIDLARRGERSPTRLRDRVLREAGLAEYALDTTKLSVTPSEPHRTNAIGRTEATAKGTRSRVLVGSRACPR